MASTDIACPTCHQIDAVRKVTSIVSEGTTATTSGAGSMTVLAHRLAPPAENVPKVSAINWARIIAASVLMLLSFLCAIMFFVGAFGTSEESRPLFFIAAGVLILISIASVGYLGFAILIRASARSQINAEKNRFEHAKAIWQTLYYCGRCDKVYIPGDSRSLPPEQISAYYSSQHS